MEPRLAEIKRQLRNGYYKQFRTSAPVDVLTECCKEHLSWPRRNARLIRRMCEAQRPVILPGERIVFTRTVNDVPSVYSASECKEVTGDRTLFGINNICADWGMVLSQGLLGRRNAAMATRQAMSNDPEAVEFLDGVIETLDAVIALAHRYAAEARTQGRHDLAALLEAVPAQPARTFHEALQSLRLCQAVLWLGGHGHCGLGRFDQYMWPYLEADLESGRLTREEAESLLAEFFLSLNRDSDLYFGVQQGDNGQSLMLGGVRRDGTDAVNPLTAMVLRVVRGTAVIDPKINLRVTPETPTDLLDLAAELTKIGLGFPQYSNDDKVISALVAHGYSLEDARDYTVAACWEFIIPGKGLDVVNIGAVSMPHAVDQAIRRGLCTHGSFENILGYVSEEMDRQVTAVVKRCHPFIFPPAPYYSALVDGCLERGRDISHGLVYNNFGIHGACSSNAADALAAVKTLVFDQQRVPPERLITALDTNFENDEPLRALLQNEPPKVGNNDPLADAMLVEIFNRFADACEKAKDAAGGRTVRPGSGSAMYYVWLAQGCEGMPEPVVGATADGRKRGELFSSSLAPSPGVKVHGPLSVLQTYAKLDYQRICNGGPITMEFTDSVFRNPEAIHQVALFIRLFAQTGCQQLQINTLNVETLKDARIHPERHRNLVVRVWGWSGYFCELDTPYQDQIIARHCY